MHDVRYALRVLRGSPGFAAVPSCPSRLASAQTPRCITCVATVLVGVLQALRLVRRDIVPLMKPASAGGGSRLRPSAILMAAQIAGSVPLVAGAVIFLGG